MTFSSACRNPVCIKGKVFVRYTVQAGNGKLNALVQDYTSKLLTRAQPDLFWNQGPPFLYVPERLNTCNPEENYDGDNQACE